MTIEQRTLRILTEHNSDGTHNAAAATTLKTLFPASATPAANTIPITGADGTLVLGFLPIVYAFVTGSNATTTSLTLVDITGLSVPLVANAKYDIEAHVSGNSSTVAGVKHGINFSASGATIEGYSFASVDGGTAIATQRVMAFNTPTAAIGQAADIESEWYAIVNTGANAGNLTMQHLKVTSGTSTVYIDSFMKVTRVA